jgi:hypothetical protein
MFQKGVKVSSLDYLLLNVRVALDADPSEMQKR